MKVQTMEKSKSEILAEFITGLDRTSIPEDVAELVRWHILDSAGLACLGAATPYGRQIQEASLALGADGTGTVIGSDMRLSAPYAALVNGSCIHAEDYDDTVYAPIVHPSSVIVGAALALGEQVDASADDVITAMVAGYETIIRIGLAAPGKFVAHGWHGTSVFGVFAAAAIASSLWRLSPQTIVDAFGIAGSLASGITEYLGDGTATKRFHPGWAAMSGINAAAYARAGVDGPRWVFEGRNGIYNSFLGRAADDIDQLSDGLGTNWVTRDIAFKLYPMCHYLHAYADCLLELRREHGLAAERVAAIECTISERQIPIICEPAERKYAPSSPYEAKFSLPYIAAAAMIDGKIKLGTFDIDQIQRPDLLDFASRVSYVIDPQSIFPRSFPGAVKITLADGTVLRRAFDEPLGSPGRPTNWDALETKFRENLSFAGSKVIPDLAIEKIRSFAGAASIRDLLETMRPAK